MDKLPSELLAIVLQHSAKLSLQSYLSLSVINKRIYAESVQLRSIPSLTAFLPATGDHCERALYAISRLPDGECVDADYDRMADEMDDVWESASRREIIEYAIDPECELYRHNFTVDKSWKGRQGIWILGWEKIESIIKARRRMVRLEAALRGPIRDFYDLYQHDAHCCSNVCYHESTRDFCFRDQEYMKHNYENGLACAGCRWQYFHLERLCKYNGLSFHYFRPQLYQSVLTDMSSHVRHTPYCFDHGRIDNSEYGERDRIWDIITTWFIEDSENRLDTEIDEFHYHHTNAHDILIHHVFPDIIEEILTQSDPWMKWAKSLKHLHPLHPENEFEGNEIHWNRVKSLARVFGRFVGGSVSYDDFRASANISWYSKLLEVEEFGGTAAKQEFIKESLDPNTYPRLRWIWSCSEISRKEGAQVGQFYRDLWPMSNDRPSQVRVDIYKSYGGKGLDSLELSPRRMEEVWGNHRASRIEHDSIAEASAAMDGMVLDTERGI